MVDDLAAKGAARLIAIRALEEKLFPEACEGVYKSHLENVSVLEKIIAVQNAFYYDPALTMLRRLRFVFWYRPRLRAEIDKVLEAYKEKVDHAN